MYAKYSLFAMVSVAADLLAFILAPIAALPIFVRVEQGREYLISFWKWITTHDAQINSGHLDNYWPAPTTKLGLYWSRVRWIWRNPAYQVGHWLGYDQEGIVITKHTDGSSAWDSGKPSRSYWTAINSNGQNAFLWERQIYFYKNRCIELQFGWKLYRKDPDKICMLALRISPFKQYPKPSK